MERERERERARRNACPTSNRSFHSALLSRIRRVPNEITTASLSRVYNAVKIDRALLNWADSSANGRFLAGLLSYLSLNRHVTGERG